MDRTRLGWVVLAFALALTGGCDKLKELGKKGAEQGETTTAPGQKEEPVPTPGTPCPREDDATCKGADTMVTCTTGKWKEIKCRGPKGCEKGGLFVKCDESLAAAGEPCGKEENYSCTQDKAAELKCVGGAWKQVGFCRGPKACEAKFPFVNCDTTISNPNDPCEKDGNAACSNDGKTILECKGGKFVSKQKCPKACKVEGIFIKCGT